MAEHPSLDELQGFARGGLTPQGSRRVVAHLLRGCPLCGIRLLPEMFAGAAEDSSDDPAYDGALDRVFDAHRRHGPAAFEVMVKARQALAVLEAGGIAALAEAPMGLKGLASCEALLERSWSLRHDDPHEMLEMANYAVLLADHLRSERLDPAKLSDLQCRAWAALGNAYRVNDDLESAEWALRQAAALLLQGTGDLRLIAYVLDFQASLSCAQRRFPLAFEALDTVHAIHLRLQEDHLAGRALISKGLYTGYAEDFDEAVRMLTEGLAMIDRERDPELALSAIHNIAWFLMEGGQFRRARNLIWEQRWHYNRHGGQIDQVKLCWLEARINAGMDKLADAEKGLREAREGLERVGMRYHSALAGLDLASILIRLELLEEARTMVLEATAVFVELKIHAEAQAAVDALKVVFEKRMQAEGWLDRTILFLRRIEYDPTLTFAAWFL